MAAPSSKPTAVHYTLIVFVLLSLVLGVMTFMFHKELQERKTEAEKLTKQSQDDKSARQRAETERNTLKQLIGHNFETVGNPGENQPNTMVGAMYADIALAGQPAQPTMSAALRSLAATVQTLQADLGRTSASLDQTNQRLLALQGEYQQRVDEEQRAKQGAETDREARTRQFTEDRDKLLADIRTQQTELQNLQRELDDLNASFAKARKEWETAQRNYQTTIRQLRVRIDEYENISFEVPQGEIVMINHDLRMVTISLGSADGLRKGTTFSVYRKINSGVGRRGNEDLKAKIEVTRVTDRHRAEAKITEDSIYDPITPGDPIYTPLWAPGRTLAFSVVGGIDMDGDGKATDDDRALFHEVVQVNGGTIDNEVNDLGELKGSGQLTANTKFLIVGLIPEITETSTPEQRRAVEEVGKNYKLLNDQATQLGVRVVNLEDFKNFIGFKTPNRVYKPGEDKKFNLKYGSRSSTVNETLGNRESSGTTSGKYSRDKRLKPVTSTGQTSKAVGP